MVAAEAWGLHKRSLEEAAEACSSARAPTYFYMAFDSFVLLKTIFYLSLVLNATLKSHIAFDSLGLPKEGGLFRMVVCYGTVGLQILSSSPKHVYCFLPKRQSLC